ncbi:MAG: bacteriophage holin [Ignavibacteria bacterium]|nr:bacteriophage holin [Ignavibacteria bacterium]
MKLNVKPFALTCGILWGLALLLGTWWLLILSSAGEIISNLSAFYIGYSYSWGGVVIGLLWGFVDGFICGAIFAWLYNKLTKVPS